MKNLLINSVAGRTIIVLLIGLTVSHFASLLVFRTESDEALNLLRDRLVAERMALITRLVENTPESDRERVLTILDSPGLRVTEGADVLPGEEPPETQRPHILAHILRLYLGNRSDEGVLVSFTEAGEERRITDLFGPGDAALQEHSEHVGRYIESLMADTAVTGTVKASVQLSDASWLLFSAPLSTPAPFSMRITLSLAIMLLAVIGFTVWAVHRWTAPMTAFANAAERLGVDVNAPPLPESGLLEVRRAAHAFNQMQERIRRFVEDRTQMVAAIAHDLGTPITRLRLRAEYVEDEEQRQKVLGDLEEMEQMIASTLAFAREDGVNEPRETFDLNSLLESICDDFADAGQAVEFRADGRLAYDFRLVALRRAFTNLIENAVKYGSSAQVLVEERPDAIVVRIDDDGPGIPEEAMEQVFEPFRRLDESRSRETGGTGLGLAVARSIVRSHGGDVILRNRAEGGLRSEVILPR
jgi:signal transduction histidine kinase